MKQVIAFLALVTSVSSFAQDRVILNSSEVSVNAAEAILVRTSETPKKVKVTFKVPMANSYCAETSIRDVVTTCSRTIYVNTREQVCVQRELRTNRCVRFQVRYVNRPATQRYSCVVPQSYCSRYDVGTATERDTVKFKFKNLPALGGSEEETFLVRANQKRVDSGNVLYDVTPSSTLGQYEVKNRGFLGADKYVIQPKK